MLIFVTCSDRPYREHAYPSQLQRESETSGPDNHQHSDISSQESAVRKKLLISCCSSSLLHQAMGQFGQIMAFKRYEEATVFKNYVQIDLLRRGACCVLPTLAGRRDVPIVATHVEWEFPPFHFFLADSCTTAIASLILVKRHKEESESLA